MISTSIPNCDSEIYGISNGKEKKKSKPVYYFTSVNHKLYKKSLILVQAQFPQLLLINGEINLECFKVLNIISLS